MNANCYNTAVFLIKKVNDSRNAISKARILSNPSNRKHQRQLKIILVQNDLYLRKFLGRRKIAKLNVKLDGCITYASVMDVRKYKSSSPWWRHRMETFSALLAICAGNSPHKGQWRWALMFSLICAWINDWINNREAGDLKRHRAHYDVIVML